VHDGFCLRLIRKHNYTALPGHAGQGKTFDTWAEDYYRKRMQKDIGQYVCNFNHCQWSHSWCHWTFGVLQPVMVPNTQWEDISKHFVVWLLECKGYDITLVVVDRLWKMWHFVPCVVTPDAPELAKLFIRVVVRLHGLPLTIESDRGSWSPSMFWGYMCDQLFIDQRMSAAFHMQTNWQTE